MEELFPKLRLKIMDPMELNEIRVRYAPSPTGKLHIGGARAALFNFLFAKKTDGLFILRIEDTDLERSKKEFEDDIFNSLVWLGLKWDEGPIIGSKSYSGKFGPYRQSERGDIYEKYINKMIDENKAYYCFCSPEDLEAQREYQTGRGESPKYVGTCSNLTKSEIEDKKERGLSSVIRLRTPLKKVKFHDLIRGDIEIDSDTIGDIVIAKDERTPLYNLAVVIDDYEMKITHVIRGEDHISNTPKQILIAESLGINSPIFGHLPLVLGPDKSKMSKRHGSVSVIEYKEKGYLPEAMINFISFLGWNPGTEKEIYSIESLISDFTIEKVQKSGAVFNIKKLENINSFYIKELSPQKITELALPFLINSDLIRKEDEKYISADNEELSLDYITSVVVLHQKRMKTLSEISEFADLFFKEIIVDKDLLTWKDMIDKRLKELLDKTRDLLSKIDNSVWNEKEIENVIMPFAEETGDRGEVLWPLRAALTGKKASAGPFEVAAILGKKKSLTRVEKAISII